MIKKLLLIPIFIEVLKIKKIVTINADNINEIIIEVLNNIFPYFTINIDIKFLLLPKYKLEFLL